MSFNRTSSLFHSFSHLPHLQMSEKELETLMHEFAKLYVEQNDKKAADGLLEGLAYVHIGSNMVQVRWIDEEKKAAFDKWHEQQTKAANEYTAKFVSSAKKLAGAIDAKQRVVELKAIIAVMNSVDNSILRLANDFIGFECARDMDAMSALLTVRKLLASVSSKNPASRRYMFFFFTSTLLRHVHI